MSTSRAWPSAARWNAIAAAGHLRAGRHRRLSQLGADERRAGAHRRCRAPGHDRAGAGWRPEPVGAGGRGHCRGARDLPRSAAPRRSAALAYGTETIAPVDKITGPGNAYVAAAKRRVFGAVGIDMIAGPSEILVVADGRNDPAWIAADLLVAGRTRRRRTVHPDHRRRRLRRRGGGRGRRASRPAAARPTIARESWQRQRRRSSSSTTLDEAPGLIDRLAPEHLELAVEAAEEMAARVRHAGAIFLGRYTPEAIGDYVAGPNHVLPTARSARFSSGFGVLDFMKRTSLMRCDEQGLNAIGPTAITLADAEGLDAHALSVAIRLNRRRPESG